ncbi:MAG: hypothetical protein GY715_15050 [Planctomycetes bacterium]|nr:hypothetical protein [Planctomycetota bacterium]
MIAKGWMTMDDATLLEQFENQTLPFDQWTHRTHVKVAYLYVTQFPLEEAIDRMRRGIKAYNAANDVPEGPQVGYDETTTVAFAHLVDAVNRAYASTFPTDSADSFCDTHPQLLSRHVLRFFYTPQQRIHPDAKTKYVEPDMAPLPVVPGA